MSGIDNKKMKEALDALFATGIENKAKDAVIKFAEALGYKAEKRYKLMPITCPDYDPKEYVKKFSEQVCGHDGILQVRVGGPYAGRGFFLGKKKDWDIVLDPMGKYVLTHKSIVEEVKNGL